MKVLKVLLSVLLTTLLFSQTVFAYNPTEGNYQRCLNTIYFVQDPNNLTQADLNMIECVDYCTPYEIMELFKQEGVRIYITKGVSIADRTYEHGNYNAITYAAYLTWNTSSKKITKKSSPVSVYIYDNTTDVTIFYHEFGHVLDDLAEYITGYYKGEHPISNSSEWQNIYAQNAATMARFDSTASANVTLDASEGFAEAFRLYYVHPNELQAYCPSVYTYVDSQISKYLKYLKPLTYSNFDAFDYYMHYPDVAQAVGTDRKALWNHYVNSGKAEGRIAKREAK